MVFATIFFIWCLTAPFLDLFSDKVVRYSPFFKLFLVEGEVTSFDEVHTGREHYFLTIITYTKYDMTYKTFVYRSLKDKVGDKISIYTDGDISVRDKIYLGKGFFEKLLYDLIGMLVLGSVLISNLQEVKWIYVGIGFLTVLLLLLIYPILYNGNCSRIKNKLGYLYRYR